MPVTLGLTEGTEGLNSMYEYGTVEYSPPVGLAQDTDAQDDKRASLSHTLPTALANYNGKARMPNGRGWRRLPRLQQGLVNLAVKLGPLNIHSKDS